MLAVDLLDDGRDSVRCGERLADRQRRSAIRGRVHGLTRHPAAGRSSRRTRSSSLPPADLGRLDRAAIELDAHDDRATPVLPHPDRDRRVDIARGQRQDADRPHDPSTHHSGDRTRGLRMRSNAVCTASASVPSRAAMIGSIRSRCCCVRCTCVRVADIEHSTQHSCHHGHVENRREIGARRRPPDAESGIETCDAPAAGTGPPSWARGRCPRPAPGQPSVPLSASSIGGGSKPSMARKTISSSSESTMIVSPAWNSFHRIFSESVSST